MKASTLCIGLIALAGFLYLSRVDYEMALEEAEAQRAIMQEAERARAADSLGLAGQEWLDFVDMGD